MNTSISLLSSTAYRYRCADIRKSARAAVCRAYTAYARDASANTIGAHPEHQEHMRLHEYEERMWLSEYVPVPNVSTADSQHVDQSTTVAQRLHAIRQRLDAPTHARCTSRRASIAVVYTVDGESGEVVREAYCDTCKAFDVSGLHRQYGHRVG